MAKKKKTGAVKPISAGLPVAMRGFTPYIPSPPPTGSYDPALDQQQRAAGRGIGDLRQDIATANLRAGVDYGLDRGDLIRARDRGYFDIDTSRTRGTEDYGEQIKALQRSYTQLQRRQAEGARVAGVLSGGIAMQAAQKRAENMAIDRRPLDTSFQRFMADTALQRSRLGEDTDQGLGRLDIGYQRGMDDRNLVQLPRAEREFVEFGQDIGEQKGFQASQYGWEPPGMPKNQGVNRAGTPYLERVEGDYIVRYDPQGRVLSRRLRPGRYGTVRPGSRGLPGTAYGTVRPLGSGGI